MDIVVELRLEVILFHFLGGEHITKASESFFWPQQTTSYQTELGHRV
jgi:hypothetical protein